MPGQVWAVLAADSLSALGSGLTLPFLLIYLTQVHGFSYAAAGAATALMAVAGLAGNPAGGVLADRAGPKASLVLGLAIAGTGAAALAVMAAPWQGFTATAVLGLGIAIAWPAQDALLARLVSENGRPAVFGVRFATMNLGLGAGAALSSVVLDPSRPASFAALYWLDAATFLLAIPLMLVVATGVTVMPVTAASVGRDVPRGYRAVIADRSFRRLWIFVAALVTVGYSQFNSALPAVASSEGGVDPRLLGLVFSANMVTIVVAQLVSVRLAAALTDVVRRAPVHVRIGTLPRRRFPASVEATAYFVVSEALTNVARHSGSSAARVDLDVEKPSSLVVTVADDGVGGASLDRGSGLRGLADRVALLDGSLEVTSPPGVGTSLRARIPLPA
jgi:MFS family permease